MLKRGSEKWKFSTQDRKKITPTNIHIQKPPNQTRQKQKNKKAKM